MSRSRQNRGGAWVIAQMPFLVVALIVPVAQRLFSFPGPWPRDLVWVSRGIGLAALLASVLLYRSAKVVLGPNLIPFPRPPEGSTLRIDGIYGRIRHPVYLAIMVGLAGWALLWTSVLDLMVAALAAPFFVLKSHHEERFLMEAFPDYAGYRDIVPAFLPWRPPNHTKTARED